jgi:hypothetical protein
MIRAARKLRLALNGVPRSTEIEALPIGGALKDHLAEIESRLAVLEARGTKSADQPWAQALHIPSPALHRRPASDPFMAYSTCSAADLFHPRCAEIGALFNQQVQFHRKFWEWVFILNCALTNDIGASKTALGFGVGTEPLPAVLAKLGTQVVATDAPAEIGVGSGWTKTNEFANSAETLRFDGILDQDIFQQRVRYRSADMNDIASDLTGFDFCWSSCCLEHLGSLQHGIDFIINSVERTLKIGGIACHTTELNLSSNEATVESGHTVLYRKRDLDALVAELRDRGHEVADIRVAPDAHHLDAFVDYPPYAGMPHLKLQLAGYACTSVGIIVKRGR